MKRNRVDLEEMRGTAGLNMIIIYSIRFSNIKV